MKLRFVFLLGLAGLLAFPASAQLIGPIAITSNQCAIVATDERATVGIYVLGTWTGTLQPEASILGQAAFNVQTTPSTSSTAQSTITADGAYVVPVAGYSSFLLCGNTVSSGTANIYLNASAAQLGGNTSSAGGSAFSGLTSGTNAAGIFGVGGSISPSSAGQIQGNQIILQSGLPAVVATASLTGGTLLSGHSISIRYTLNTAAGETLPSVWYNVSNASLGCSSGSTCSITVTAPTIPSGYTGYTIYSQDCGAAPCGGGTELRQIASAACVNITTNCVIGTAGTGAAMPTANTAFLQPPSVTTNNCPDGVIPQVFLQRTDGTYFGLAGVDSSSGNPLPTPDGTATICGRLFINDSGQSMANSTQQGGGPMRTSLVTIAHKAGRLFTPNSGIDDRVWSLRGTDVQSGTDTFHQFLGYYGEQFVYNPNFQCNPIGSAGAGEDCIANIRARADVVVNTITPITGVVGGHFTASTDVAPVNIASCAPCVIGVAGESDQGATGASAVSYAAVSGFANAASGSTGSAYGVDFWAIPPTVHFPGGNYGMFILSGFNGVNDYGIRDDATAPNKFQGSMQLGAPTAIIENATQSIGVTGSIAATAGLSTAQLATPAAPAVSTTGTPGSTSYTYKICSVDAAGAVCGATNTIATGNATLDTNNWNHIAISCANADLPGASRVDVYRTASGGTPSSTGKIGSIAVTDIASGCATIFLDDKGLAGDSTNFPNGNTTGALSSPTLVSSGNRAYVTADFTDANSAALQAITGLTFNVLPISRPWSFHCSIMYSQATPVAGDQFGVGFTVNAPANLSAFGTAYTNTGAASPVSTGVLTGLVTTTPTAIVTFQPAVATVLGATIDGTVEPPASGGGTLNFYVLNGTAANVIVIKRDSYCTVN